MQGKMVQSGLKALVITGGIMLLFYRSWAAIIFFPLVLYGVIRWDKQRLEDKRKIQLQGEFLHGIGVLNSALQAGLSMENAWIEVQKESKILYGEQGEFYRGIKEINQRVAHNTPIERLFLEYAYQCKLADMIQFGELLEYGKRSGSNWKKIIDVTVAQMTEQHEAQQQIEVMIAEKKMEQQIMNIMPLGLLAFLQICSWDYMSVLYHNWLGVIAMTVFLAGYVLAIALSERIMRVQV